MTTPTRIADRIYRQTDQARLDELPIGSQVRARVGLVTKTVRFVCVKVGYQPLTEPGSPHHGDWLGIFDGEVSRWSAEQLTDVEYPGQQAVWPPEPLPTEPGTVIRGRVNASDDLVLLVRVIGTRLHNPRAWWFDPTTDRPTVDDDELSDVEVLFQPGGDPS